MEVVLNLLGYRKPDIEKHRHELALRVIHGVSLGVVGAYGVALAYKAGVVAKILPDSINTSLEEKVNAIKKWTEPRVNTTRFTAARSHLLSVYTQTAGYCCLSALGSAAFFKAPYVPIGLPVALTAVPAAAIALAPREYMSEPGRLGLSLVAVFSCGYSFGPLNWVAYDSVLPFACVVASTFAGFSAPLYLTRGLVSYFLSSQLLSGTLAVLSATSLGDNEDINVMLTAQMVGSFALGAFHTIPTILKYISNKSIDTEDDAEAEEAKADVVMESLCIYGAMAYVVWTSFRYACLSIFRRMTREDASGMTKDERQKLQRFASVSTRLEKASDIAASILFLFLYVKVVGSMQRRGQTSKQFDALRRIFVRLSPVSMMINS